MTAAAWIYAALCAVVASFQLALVGGAPWGHLTQGGQSPGVLPPGPRAFAALSALLLVLMALAVLSAAGKAGLAWPRWTGWAALALTALTTALNWLTPSAPERLLWGPVTLVMLVAAVRVMIVR